MSAGKFCWVFPSTVRFLPSFLKHFQGLIITPLLSADEYQHKSHKLSGSAQNRLLHAVV